MVYLQVFQGIKLDQSAFCHFVSEFLLDIKSDTMDREML